LVAVINSTIVGAMDNKKIIEFPDVENKLHVPTKKSVFERQKELEREKRLREEAETAAVYEDFVKSFDDEDPPSYSGGSRQDGGFRGFGGMSGPPKRHFGGSAIPTGPAAGRGGFAGRSGGFGSGAGSLGPPPNLSRKRTHEAFQQPQRNDRRDNDRGLLAFDDYESAPPPRRAFNTSDDEDDSRQGHRSTEPAIAKPTLRLSSLPPGTSPAVIKALLPSNLTVDAVRIMPPSGPSVANERRSMSAIVTLSKETPGADIDAAVNSLQNRYLGYGFYLSLHRHLSSAALSSATSAIGAVSSSNSMPFGAKPINLDAGPQHGPPGQHRGFAPPSSYASGLGQPNRTGPLLYVPVQAPKDIRELKLIHKTIESLLTHGPELEALLMSRPEVQKEEKWAWLWDARSIGGVWYRWRLWEILTGSQNRKNRGKFLPLFEDSFAWKSPETPLPFEYTTRLDEFVSDSDYNSSDDDESGDEGGGRRHHGAAPPDATGLNNDDGTAYLNPLEKAKLTHLLARLPTSTAKLRKGDVARVTAFAISHAGRGADEVVAAIVSNIERPFTYTSANLDRRRDKEHSGDDGTPAAATEEDEKEDTSSASLIGLYIVSDILSSSSTSGVRHAWRYRQLFETALRQRHIFEGLGRMERKMNWGRLRAEKWKRSVGNILSLWEGWCVFPQESQGQFVESFNNPPAGKEEEKEKKDGPIEGKGKSKWKAVEVVAEKDHELDSGAADQRSVDNDIDGQPMEEDDDDVDGEPMDEDVDGEPMEEDGEVDGEPMEDDDYEPPPVNPPSAPEKPSENNYSEQTSGPNPTRQPRRRPKAEDMFADSGSDGD
jgi:U2-associated protein SR140